MNRITALFQGIGNKKDEKNVKTKFDRFNDALKELNESLKNVNIASDLCADAVNRAAVKSNTITENEVFKGLPQNRMNVEGYSSLGGRKSRRGGKKSRRAGKKSRRGGKKSRRGGKKSRRAGKKSRRGRGDCKTGIN